MAENILEEIPLNMLKTVPKGLAQKLYEAKKLKEFG
jgi:hypothetical protein